jgi:hypothetical protein
LLKPLVIVKAALAEKCGFISARLCFFGREKSERELLLFFNIKATGAVALGQSRSEKRRKFWFFRE